MHILGIVVMLLPALAAVCPAAASAVLPADAAEETMLMFIGESQPVVTVASRSPESPATAPAIVTVIDREEIAQRGYRTLAELLADQPGFFIAAGGRGSVPYLRGLRDAVLFLYDGVPLATDVTKSFAPLDRELNLAAVDRVEIVRGPGSVLWGPDAFAGVVNIVPLSGRRHPGAGVSLQGGSDNLRGGTVSWGERTPDWEAFLFAGGVLQEFWQPGYDDWQPDGAGLDAEIDPSRFAELTGTLKVGDWLQLSGRWTDFVRRYTMHNAEGTIRWAGERETPVNQVKISVSKAVGASHYSLSGYYQETDYRISDADVGRSQRNRVTYGEFLWDRRLFGHGLLTLGSAWRRNAVSGALVRDGFLPEFLSREEPFFTPRIKQADFDNTLTSLFGQFRYRWGGGEWWAGARLDDHSQYRSTVSYSLGFQRPLSDALHFKASYGTAFRSPYSRQLFDDFAFDPEEISTATLQFNWTPAADRGLELTLFHSRLRDQRAEDPYGGLSLPVSRELYGAELAGRAPLSAALSVSGHLAVTSAGHDDEKFNALRFCFVRPGGSTVCVYDRWSEPADQGPAWQARLALRWRIAAGHTLDLGARAAGSFDYSYRKGALAGEYAQPPLVDLVWRRERCLVAGDALTLRITNLLDRDYRQPDLYGPVNGPPLQASLHWEYRF
ncbi:MAG: TonB-dependent receptor plug domain-containing protein [Desulfuromonadales bacterium]|nr:TonB-dependent receptor plug domain-containing protein [Desulfuromonadales bacterium]